MPSKAYVDGQKFNCTTEIMDAMKEMFRDVLQQVMADLKKRPLFTEYPTGQGRFLFT